MTCRYGNIRYVTVMDHPTCIRSLDVRVAGVAGGSLVRISNNRIIDVGPRSAHIAGLRYSCFVEPEELDNARIITFKPKETDPDDYVCIETSNNKKIAITNTCAANALGLINKEDYAFGNKNSAIKSLSLLGEKIGANYQRTAEMILDFSLKKILHIMNPMIKEYQLDEKKTVLIGGGGGASVLVPFLATKYKFKHEIAKKMQK